MRITQRFTYANVASTLALLIAVGGGGVAYASVTNNSVRTQHIVNGQVKNADLGGSAVTGPKVKDGALAGKDFHPQAPGMVQAGVWISSGVVRTWFNRRGGAPTVSSPSTGVYHVTIPGAPLTDSNRLIALASSRNYLRECRVMDANNGHITVFCTDNSDETFQATSFDLVLIKY